MNTTPTSHTQHGQPLENAANARRFPLVVFWLSSCQATKRPFQAFIAILAIASQTPPCVSSAPLMAALSGVLADRLKRGKTAVSNWAFALFTFWTKGPRQ